MDKAETKSFDIVLGEKLFCFENNQFKHEENRGEYERKIQPKDVCVAPPGIIIKFLKVFG